MRTRRPTELPMVSAEQETWRCPSCRRELGLLDFRYAGIRTYEPNWLLEVFECRLCGAHFTMKYGLFDQERHISTWLFTGDPNDPAYSPMAELSAEQVNAISLHLSSCPICRRRQIDELLDDAWFADLVHRLPRSGTDIHGH